MNNFSILLAVVLFSTNICAQSRTLIGYDLESGATDTISNVDVLDQTSDKTNFYIGDFNPSIAELPSELDLENLFGNSQWTNREAADLNFDLNDFPIRTSIKLFRVAQDSLFDQCSGSIIGSKYVLSAGHCITDNQANIIFTDILICPAYNNGLMNEFFECHSVEKVYLFEDWKVGEEDFGIYQLGGDIGQKTGWISIGFDENITFQDDLLHKFSYPNFSIIDSLQYNGDTLYHSFGFADIFYEADIGITGTTGLPGESGSSIIHVDDDVYTTYGVSTYSGNMNHTRIEKQHFYPFQELLTRDGLSSNKDFELSLGWKMFPNPANTHIQFTADNFPNKTATIRIYDWSGRLILTNKVLQEELIDVSSLISGTYLLRITIDDADKTFKFMKN